MARCMYAEIFATSIFYIYASVFLDFLGGVPVAFLTYIGDFVWVSDPESSGTKLQAYSIQ